MKHIKYITFDFKNIEYLKPKIERLELAALLQTADHLLGTGRFAEAITSYHELLKKISKGKEPRLYGYIKSQEVICLKHQAFQAAGTDNLQAALPVLAEILPLYNNKQNGLEAAMGQSILASIHSLLAVHQDNNSIALALQAGEAARETTAKFLERCNSKQNPVAAMIARALLTSCDIALAEYRDPEFNLTQAANLAAELIPGIDVGQFPSVWALTQFNLGQAHHLLAEYREPLAHYHQAIAAYQAALIVYRQQPGLDLEYFFTQSCLAGVYIDLNQVQPEKAHLFQAIKICQESLQTFTANPKYSLAYALILHNLGMACKLLAQINHQADYLDKALRYFNEVLVVENLALEAEFFASTFFNLGLIHLQMAETRDRLTHLTQAVEQFQAALQIYSLEVYPDRFGLIHTQLGKAHFALAELAEPDKNGIAAIHSFIEALRAYPGESNCFAKNKYYLGMAYRARAKTAEPETNLPAAAASFEAALTVFTLENHPADFRLAQNGLGDSYWALAEGQPTDEVYLKAIAAFENALQSLPMEPLQQGEILTKLALCCQDYAKHRNREGNLNKALKTFRNALQILTPTLYPVEFGETNCKLAALLSELAGRNQKAYYLDLAIQAWEAALKVFSYAKYPERYAQISGNLGNHYLSLAEIARDKGELLKKAVALFEAALTVYTITKWPLEFAGYTNKIGMIYQTMAETCDLFSFKSLDDFKEYKVDRLSNAMSAFHHALLIFTPDNYPAEYANLQINIGSIYVLMADIQSTQDNLAKACSALKEALKVFTLDKFPKENRRVHMHLERVKARIV